MGFWWFMLVCNAVTPGIMIVGGWMMWKHCPRKINGVYGYRTSRSMKNMDTWQFAHDLCGRLWWKLGWALLVPSVLAHLFVLNRSETAVSVVSAVLVSVQIIILLVSIAMVEKALKKTFLPDGTRR